MFRDNQSGGSAGADGVSDGDKRQVKGKVTQTMNNQADMTVFVEGNKLSNVKRGLTIEDIDMFVG